MSEQITPEQARKVLAEERQTKLQACQIELEAVLKKYNVQLAVNISVVEGRIVGNVVLAEAVNAI